MQFTKQKLNSAIIAVCFSIFTTACEKNETIASNLTTDEVAGYLYTTTNGEGTNQVIRFARHDDGSLADETAFSTNSLGGADRSMGGDAFGDFDSQGALQIIGNYLLAVNAGGNDVSVFSLDRSNGNLTHKSNTPSGGGRPVSIAYIKKESSDNEYWIVVGNQLNNPNVQKDPPMLERYPDDAYFQQDLTMTDPSDNQRNIQLFSFDATDGTLTSAMTLDNYVRENGGPSCVSFSEDGTKLAVSTWGIAHFGAMMPLLSEQHPSRVYVYDFSNGTVSNERYFEQQGIAGTIGITWAKGSSSKLYASNFNVTADMQDNALTVLSDDGSAVTKSENHAVTDPAAMNEACWTTINPAGNTLFVASFASNLVSSFDISGSSANLFQSEKRGDLAPMGDSKELLITRDNKYLYNLGSLSSFSINRFDIMGSGITYKAQYILSTTADGAGSPGKYNFLGLVDFDLTP